MPPKSAIKEGEKEPVLFLMFYRLNYSTTYRVCSASYIGLNKEVVAGMIFNDPKHFMQLFNIHSPRVHGRHYNIILCPIAPCSFQNQFYNIQW